MKLIAALCENLDEQAGFKEFLRTNKTGLKKFIRLHDLYKSEGDLSSKDATNLMADLMTLFKGTESSTLGSAVWEPNALSFATFLDSIGETPLAEFLGISSISELPDADMDTRADEIRKDAIQKPEEPPQPQLSSVTRLIKRNPLTEGRSATTGRGSFMRLHREAMAAKIKKTPN